MARLGIRLVTSNLNARCWNWILIALDIAHGLHYLQNLTEPAHIHKDIKSSTFALWIFKGWDNKYLSWKICRRAGQRVHIDSILQSERLHGLLLLKKPVTPKLDLYAFVVGYDVEADLGIYYQAWWGRSNLANGNDLHREWCRMWADWLDASESTTLMVWIWQKV